MWRFGFRSCHRSTVSLQLWCQTLDQGPDATGHSVSVKLPKRNDKPVIGASLSFWLNNLDMWQELSLVR